jgi:hypothetical protein
LRLPDKDRRHALPVLDIVGAPTFADIQGEVNRLAAWRKTERCKLTALPIRLLISRHPSSG